MSREYQAFSDRLRGSDDKTRQVIWDRRTSTDSRQLWTIPCPERWELLPESERKMRSHCCAAICYLAEIRLWSRSISQGTIATSRTCGGCGKPTSIIKVIRNDPHFTPALHQAIRQRYEDALSLGVEVRLDGSWEIPGTVKAPEPDIRAQDANQPEQPEFAG